MFHHLLNVRKINKSNIFDEKLTAQGSFVRKQNCSAIQAFFEVTECLLYNVSQPVQAEGFCRILDLIADKGKEPIPFRYCVDGILLIREGNTSNRSLADDEVFLVKLFVVGNTISAKDFGLQPVQLWVELDCIIGIFLRVVVQVGIYMRRAPFSTSSL